MSEPIVLFAHGAGASTASDWMRSWASRLDDIGSVIPFDYPYMEEGRRAPDRLPRLITAHVNAVERARSEHGGPLILIGKSMGSRVGCHVANQVGAAAVVCLGYPLRSMGKKKSIRDDVLLGLEVPTLFVQGTRDPMGPLDLFERVLSRMTANHALHVVDGGDHSLVLSKTSIRETGTTQSHSDATILEAIGAFVNTVLDR